MARRAAVLACVLLMLLPPFTPAGGSEAGSAGRGGWEVVGELQREILIPPGKHYIAGYDNATLGFKEYLPLPELTPGARRAVESAPYWLRAALERQFSELGASMDRFADLILNASEARFIDEIAFSIAQTSIDVLKLPGFYPQLFADNAASVYAIAANLSYARMTEKGDSTTVTYKNASGAEMELPRDIYYWYVVHPKITDEIPAYINPATGGLAAPPAGKFWRDYLMNHNDSGYPLLRDALSGIPTLWNGTKNAWSDNGAVGAVTKWILDVLDFGSGSERPTQPVRIYALHLGRCGEHEDITCAAARAALIPCIGAEDLAEDHVWNEFWYDGRWHQWEPVNVYVDFPESYGGWGKKFPAVNGWRGDDWVWQETGLYTQDCTFKAFVKDAGGAPVEGATVWVGVEYSPNPAYRMMATWNSTDAGGMAGFRLGKGNTLYARADSERLGGSPTGTAGSTGANPWILLASDTVLVISGAQPTEYSHNFTLSSSPAPAAGLLSSGPSTNGSYRMELELEVTGSEVRGKSVLGQHYYVPTEETPVYSFIASESECSLFQWGQPFKGYAFSSGTKNSSAQTLPDDGKWQAVVGNDAVGTLVKVSLKLRFLVLPYIVARSPAPGSLLLGGSAVTVWGIADGVNATGVELSSDGGASWEKCQYNRSTKQWRFVWNTSGLESGSCSLLPRLLGPAGTVNGEPLVVELDADDPVVTADIGGILKGGGILELGGSAADNRGVAQVELEIAGEGVAGGWRWADYDARDGSWSFGWPTDGLSTGKFTVSARAVDLVGRTNMTRRDLILDFDPPAVTFDTSGLFRGNRTIRLSGGAGDEVGLRGVAVSAGGAGGIATLENGRWAFDWDTGGLASGRYTLVATAEDLAGWNSSASSTLRLDLDAPHIGVEAPQSAEAGSAVHVEGTAEDANGMGAVELSTDGENWTGLFLDTDGAWSFDWDTSPLMPGNYSVSVRASDAVGNLAEVTNVLRLVDTTPPQITLEVARTVQAGEVLGVKARVVERTGIERVELSTDGKEWTEMAPGPKGYALEMDTTTLSLGKNRIRARAFDTAGNAGTAEREVSVEDETAPAVQILNLSVDGIDLLASGSASDNYRVRLLEYSLDGASWTPLNLTDGAWNLSLTDLKAGKQALRLRATDFSGRTAETSRDFEIEERLAPSKGFLPGFGAAALLVALIILSLALGPGRKGKGPRKD